MVRKKRFFQFVSRHRTHIFPLIVVLAIIILTLLRISGTSIGVYHEYLYGDSSRDNSLIYGQPQGIRSDEWLVSTQLTIAQEKNNFERFNDNFMTEKDMSVIVDVPYYGWSTLFKPQNHMFFILPLEFAFAFKWWFMLGSLIIASYYFALRLLKKKIIPAILISIIISFAPFVFWWYQAVTIGALAYGFLILLVGMSIVDQSRLLFGTTRLSARLSNAIRVIALSYLLIGFALLFYPPFQIPVAIVIASFMLGYLFNKKLPRRSLMRVIFTFSATVLITGSVGALYFVTRQDTISTIANTAYPGKRVVATGGYDIKRLLVTYLQPQLQKRDEGARYITNQSESSNFIVLPIFFLIPAVSLFIWLYVKQRNFEWVLFMIILCSLLFLAHLFLPSVDILVKPFLLHLVPHDRLLIGFGFLGIIMATYIMKLYIDHRIVFSKKMLVIASIYTSLFLALAIWAGIAVSSEYPGFIGNRFYIVALALIGTAGLSCIIINRALAGLAILSVFTIASVAFIHPLYVGLGPIYKGELSKAIQQTSSEDSIWAAAESIYIENLPQMSGRPAVTGVATYPDNSFWKLYSDPNSNIVYNRYAHTLLSVNDTSSLILLQPDLFAISGSCTRKISEEIDYIISTSPFMESCNKLIKTIDYPAVTFYIYRQ